MLGANSPFSFSIVNERTVLRFLKLIGCDNSKIGTYAKLVDDRNNTARPNGNILFRTQSEVDKRIYQVFQAVEEIQAHSQPIIIHCYEDFLRRSYDPDEREYPHVEDQIREVLIHSNSMSLRDIELCVNFDVSALENENRGAIEALHNTLRESYGSV